MMKTPAHPGEVLLEDILKPLSLSITAAASKIGVSRKHLSSIVNGSHSINVDIAARISALTNTSARMWLGMQNAYDLSKLDMSAYSEIESGHDLPKAQ